MKTYKKVFWFALLLPISLLVWEIRSTLVDMREAQNDLFILNAQRASNQRTILGLQTRVLHYVEGHADKNTAGCTACFKNLLAERYDHELIRQFLTENGIDPIEYLTNSGEIEQ
jgi:hypothetical protein